MFSLNDWGLAKTEFQRKYFLLLQTHNPWKQYSV